MMIYYIMCYNVYRTPYQIEIENDFERLTAALRQVLSEVKEHPSAWPFLEPVQEAQAPRYFSIVKFPMGTLLHIIIHT